MTRIVLELFHVFKLLSFFLASTEVPVSDNILTYYQPTYLPPTFLIWNKELFGNNYYCMHTLNSDLHNEKSQKGMFTVYRVTLARSPLALETSLRPIGPVTTWNDVVISTTT